MSLPGAIVSPNDFVNGGFIGITNSASNFTVLNTAELNVSKNINVNSEINNSIAEKTIDLYSPVTFNNVMSNSYYSLNNIEDTEECNYNTSFTLPLKSLITGANVVLKNISWTPEYANGIYQLENKPVLFSMGYQISPTPPVDSNGNLIFDSTGYNIDNTSNSSGRIFYKTIANNTQPENGGGVAVSSSTENSLIGQPGVQGNINISPIWIRFSVDSTADTSGEQIANSATLEIKLTSKKIKS
jgi:hypothetical protein